MKKFNVYHIMALIVAVSLMCFFARIYCKSSKNLVKINQKIDNYKHLSDFTQQQLIVYKQQIVFYASVVERSESPLHIRSRFELDAVDKVKAYERRAKASEEILNYCIKMLGKYHHAQLHPYMDVEPDPIAPPDPEP